MMSSVSSKAILESPFNMLKMMMCHVQNLGHLVSVSRVGPFEGAEYDEIILTVVCIEGRHGLT